MSRSLPFLLISFAAACAASTVEVGLADATATRPRTFARAMQQVGDLVDEVRAELVRTPQGDLQRAGGAAREAAAIVRAGYGEFRDPRVPGFAGMARDAESWLLRLAAEADQNRGAIAKALLRDGETRHCRRCHDACEAVRW